MVRLAEMYSRFIWLHALADAAILAAGVGLAGLIVYAVLHRSTQQIPLLFWGPFVLGLAGGVFVLARSGSHPLPVDAICVAAKLAMAALLWAGLAGLLRLLSCGGDFAGRNEPAEKGLAQSRSAENTRCQSILANVSDVILQVDTRGKVVEVNQQVEEMFGYSPEEIQGKHFAKLGILRAEDVVRIVRLFYRTLVAGQPEEFVELDLRHRNGKSVLVEVGTRFVRKDDQIVGAACVLRNITKRTVALEELATILARSDGIQDNEQHDLVDVKSGADCVYTDAD
jgi:PAS domain S-box-containing protein